MKDGQHPPSNVPPIVTAKANGLAVARLSRRVPTKQKCPPVPAESKDSQPRRPNQLRDEYLENISHDLTNPLSVIALQCQLLSRRFDAAGLGDQQRAVEVISQNATLLHRMLRELLLLADSGFDQEPLQLERTDLAKFLRAVLGRTVTTVDHRRIRFEIGETVWVVIDTMRIERVVMNLVRNAFKYSRPSSPIAVRLATQGNLAVVSITDQGPGIPADEVPAVFERYQRAPSSGNCEGSGLGLYISRRAIEAHSGRIGVTSVPGVGSRFFFELPLAERVQKGPVVAPRPAHER